MNTHIHTHTHTYIQRERERERGERAQKKESEMNVRNMKKQHNSTLCPYLLSICSLPSTLYLSVRRLSILNTDSISGYLLSLSWAIYSLYLGLSTLYLGLSTLSILDYLLSLSWAIYSLYPGLSIQTIDFNPSLYLVISIYRCIVYGCMDRSIQVSL